ncbi:N-acetylmuramoyl-L-alanine amidase CwlD [Fervidibacillus halotolerans]|uniref:N-acetylmuramoyl-L-alanine amidase CwlD n=1 Tax=Fervidibacillus halotolerans TaxID=2980027 RepID=A0A9E8LZI8_9BACI|nr:N-acetylmuramoyl-L-alanine amidase CwlD [Fervidibacillus halotolerans]WAA12441.1 N-acetylmuramoyl-L-alanine amidase CwlD [Fervidibacillus halotolerans]
MKKWWIFFGFLFVVIFILYLKRDDLFWRETWNAWNLPLTGRIIYIDPGHGGPDGGAEKEGVVEKDIALSISMKLRDYLEQQGAFVLLTREKDSDLADEDLQGLSRRKVQDLHRRAKLINESEADLFISIHLNAIPSPKWRGAQTFYYPRYVESEIAATLIQEELIDNLQNTDRKAKSITNVYLMKEVKKPGVLVETGFLSNPEERELLKNEDYQEKIAISIYEGIMRYFSNEREQWMNEEDRE